MVSALRSALFFAGFFAITPPFALLIFAFWRLPYGVREDTARLWCRANLLWLRVCCGVRYRVIGLEHLPPGPAVVMSNHQSAWETIAYRTIFPTRLAWVVKRELFRLPFYGMALKALEEIGVGEQSPREAMREVEEHGSTHIRAGRWVVIFPEGMRVRHGELGRFLQGGARLACANGVPVVPVAVDSGYCWPTQDWRKRPGLITVRIGPPIATTQRSPAEVNRLVWDWIAGELVDVGIARPRRGT
ncbi:MULTISPECIES: lysophospholipid acyltransferase family protein [unclassified Halorhodospira]|uniref:lysophospholipid acyltransferase family protein n=1 Tax=unclassified Halorhodospira TaxID=2626748 RepID=UPI001EE88AFD|nr:MULTISPECIES: lysophospholipid acyltransferase family protein [unclassified Halorhodospira]MCG5541879.1 1-acyl-sn-glycerol-3-phosphate acyltransferase [Halorhodospira sp. M39old]MCG5546948.1 1-acyl-sn-glycerol-3-phosphate acyltransferase [Halorhodospira sp. M38]